MKVVVSVDTEEDNAWEGGFKTSGQTVSNIGHLHNFQLLCDRYHTQPVYLVNNPVVEDVFSCKWLLQQLEQGKCEIGAHLHPWCGPPHLRDSYEAKTSYLCNLSKEEQTQKIAYLTNRIESRLGIRPVSFRAGRYGLDSIGASILGELGYRVDSSVLPFRRCENGGPDFSNAPYTPYWPSNKSLSCRANTKTNILEVPVSVGYHYGNFDVAHRYWNSARQSPWKQCKLPSFLHHTGIAKQIKAAPEQQSGKEICRLATRYAELETTHNDDCDLGVPGDICFILLVHSSSLMPGGSPYSQNIQQRDLILERLEQVLEFCYQSLQATPATLKDLAI